MIDTRAGGQSGGGASVTPLGHAALDAYAAVERDVRAAAEQPLGLLSKLLEAPGGGD